jgi:hypothetical protein
MDPSHFDAAVRSLTAGPSRRALLGRVAGGILAALGFVASDGAVARKRKKRKKKKKCRGCRVCTECVKGRCKAIPDHTACGGSCQECIGGQCVNKPDDTVCDPDVEGRCLDGGCNPDPDCISEGVSGCPIAGQCCSGVCEAGICQAGAVGTPCHDNGDCTSGSCLGYRCQ